MEKQCFTRDLMNELQFPFSANNWCWWLFGSRYLRMHLEILKDCLPQILLGPFLNTLTQLLIIFWRYHVEQWPNFQNAKDQFSRLLDFYGIISVDYFWKNKQTVVTPPGDYYHFSCFNAQTCTTNMRRAAHIGGWISNRSNQN